MNKYSKAMTSESQRRRAMTLKRRALEDGEPPRDCFDVVDRELSDVENDELEEINDYES